MKLYGAYSELEEYGMVSWHVVGFNLDFGEFFPVKRLHSRSAAEDLAKKLNIEDHNFDNNKDLMQEFTESLGLKTSTKNTEKAPFVTSGKPCECSYPSKYEQWCFFCGGDWNTRKYDEGGKPRWYSLDQLFPGPVTQADGAGPGDFSCTCKPGIKELCEFCLGWCN